MRIKGGVTPDLRAFIAVWDDDKGKGNPVLLYITKPFASESEAVAQFEDVLLPKLEKAKRSMTNSEVAFKPPGG